MARALNENEIDYVVALIVEWIERKLENKLGCAV
jgi:transcriptional antiterminator